MVVLPPRHNVQMIRKHVGRWQSIQPHVEIFEGEHGPTSGADDEAVRGAAECVISRHREKQLQVIRQERKHRCRWSGVNADLDTLEAGKKIREPFAGEARIVRWVGVIGVAEGNNDLHLAADFQYAMHFGNNTLGIGHMFQQRGTRNAVAR